MYDIFAYMFVIFMVNVCEYMDAMGHRLDCWGKLILRQTHVWQDLRMSQKINITKRSKSKPIHFKPPLLRFACSVVGQQQQQQKKVFPKWWFFMVIYYGGIRKQSPTKQTKD